MEMSDGKGGPPTRLPLPQYSSVSRECEEAAGNERIPVGKEVPFMRVYFGGGHDGDSVATLPNVNRDSLYPETSRDGSQVVWFEDVRTGEMMPTKIRYSGGEEQDTGDMHEDEDGEESILLLPTPLGNKGGFTEDDEEDVDNVESLEQGDSSGHSYAAMFLQGLFLLFQGMLAGFSFIGVAYINLDDATFVEVYQSTANDVRRLSFLLSSLSTLGALDVVFSLATRQSRPSLSSHDNYGSYGANLVRGEIRYSYTLAMASCLMYFTTLVITLVLSSTDTIIYYYFGYSGTDVTDGSWVASALSSAANASHITTWKTLVPIRIATAVLGWLCSCLLVWRELLAKDGRGHELSRLMGVISAWRNRAAELEGEGIEELDAPSLRKLQALQALGYERTNAALKVVDQEY